MSATRHEAGITRSRCLPTVRCVARQKEDPMTTETQTTTRPAVESEQGLLLFVLVMVILGVAGLFVMTA